MPRPKSVSKALRAVPTVKPDLDKLTRAVMDAISLERYCQVIKDDSLVTDLHAAKRYADHTKPGVSIMITW
jgi:Holliday junction resolvase RusA-like endonuclease